jgi:hypothetical protein
MRAPQKWTAHFYGEENLSLIVNLNEAKRITGEPRRAKSRSQAGFILKRGPATISINLHTMMRKRKKRKLLYGN